MRGGTAELGEQAGPKSYCHSLNSPRARKAPGSDSGHSGYSSGSKDVSLEQLQLVRYTVEVVRMATGPVEMSAVLSVRCCARYRGGRRC